MMQHREAAQERSGNLALQTDCHDEIRDVRVRPRSWGRAWPLLRSLIWPRSLNWAPRSRSPSELGRRRGRCSRSPEFCVLAAFPRDRSCGRCVRPARRR